MGKSLTTPDGYMLVGREDWKPNRKISPAKARLKLPNLYIHHSVTTATSSPCNDFRKLDDILGSRGLLGYNFAVHPSGVVGEIVGTGVGEHTKGHNSDGMAICFIGNFEKQQPTVAALLAAARTANLARLGGLLAANVKVRPHSDVVRTACPGTNMREKKLVGLNGKPASGLDFIRFFMG